MKINLAKVFGVLLTFGVICPHAWADDARAHDNAQALFNAASASFDKKDADGVVGIAVPEATRRYLDGTTESFEEWRARVRKDLDEMETARSKLKVERADFKGDNIIAVYTETHDYLVAKDKGHRYRSVSSWRATLTNTLQGWRAKNFTQLYEKVTRDGKPLTTASTSALDQVQKAHEGRPETKKLGGAGHGVRGIVDQVLDANDQRQRDIEQNF